MAVCRCLRRRLVITMASTWALGADNPAPKPAVPSRVKEPGGLRLADGAKMDPATGSPTGVVHEASGITLVLVPAGEFRMGQGKAEHRRVIRKPFYLGETEVSVAQFRKFAEAAKYQTDAERGVPDGDGRRGGFATTPDGHRQWHAETSWKNPFPNLKGVRGQDDLPVFHVSWNDATAFGKHFGLRLPTEAEWSMPRGRAPGPPTRGATTRPAGRGSPTSPTPPGRSGSGRTTRRSRSTTGPSCCPRSGRTSPTPGGSRT